MKNGSNFLFGISTKHFSFKMGLRWVFNTISMALINSQNTPRKRGEENNKKEYCQVIGKMSLLCNKTPLYCCFEKVCYSLSEGASVLSALRRKLHNSFVLTWLNTFLPAAPCSCFFALCLMSSTQTFKHTQTQSHTHTHCTARRAEQLK